MPAPLLKAALSGSYDALFPDGRNKYRPYALRHPVLATVGAAIVAAKGFAVLLVALTPKTASLSTITPSFLIGQANEERAKVGLPGLKSNALLAESARRKAQDMIANDYFAHTSPAGVSPWKWFDDVGYGYAYAGENLAIDFTTAENVHSAWMQSPGHKRNILSDKYREIGVAAVSGEYQGRTTTIVAVHFGSLVFAPVVSNAAPAAAEQAAPTAAPASSAAPTAAPAAITPAPIRNIEPPVIIEPSEGQLLPSGASTVRGQAEDGSIINLLLDGAFMGTYKTLSGEFAGKFTPPADRNEEAVLSATASLGGAISAPSKPVRVVLATSTAPIVADNAVVLPAPFGDTGKKMVVVPLGRIPAKLVARAEGRDFPMRLTGSAAVATVDASLDLKDLALVATEESGIEQVLAVSSMRQYNEAALPVAEGLTRKFTGLDGQVSAGISIALLVIGFLLIANILVHIKIQRADLIAHAALLLLLGAAIAFLA